MKRIGKKIAVFMLIFMLVFGTTIDSIALVTNGNEATPPDGVTTYTQVKVDPPEMGTNEYTYNGITFTVTVEPIEDGTTITAWTSSHPVYWVMTKSNGEIYYPFGGVTSYDAGNGEGLIAPRTGPDHDKDGIPDNYTEISHYTFFFGMPEADAKLTVRKDIINESSLDLPQDKFSFELLGDGSPKMFELGDDEEEVFDDLDPGEYTITETLHPDFEFTIIVNGTTQFTDNDDGSIDVILEDGDDVTVIFTNTYPEQPGTLTVVKEIEGGEIESFQFLVINGVTSSFWLGDAESKVIEPALGEYNIQETLDPGYSTEIKVESSSGSPVYTLGDEGEVDVTVGEMENVTVTYTNTALPPQGEIVVKKTVVGYPYDDVDELEFNFTIDIDDDFMLNDGGMWSEFFEADTEFEVTEDEANDGKFTTTVVLNDVSMSYENYLLLLPLTVVADETVEIEFINTYVPLPSTLTIIKEFDGEEYDRQFDFVLNGATDSVSPEYDNYGFKVSMPNPFNDNDVEPGTYELSEILGDDFILQDIDVNGAENVDVDKDAGVVAFEIPWETDVTVIFTNDWIPPGNGQLIVEKEVRNYPYDDIDSLMFNFLVDGYPGFSLADGETWTESVPDEFLVDVTEENVAKFTTTVQVMIDGVPLDEVSYEDFREGDSLVVLEGQVVKVKFINTYMPDPAQIIVRKVIEAEVTSDTFEFTINGAIGEDEPAYEDFGFSLGHNGTWSDNDVVPGRYSIQETLDLNYLTTIEVDGVVEEINEDGYVEFVIEPETTVLVIYTNEMYDPALGSLEIYKELVNRNGSRRSVSATFNFKIEGIDVEYSNTVSLTTINGEKTLVIPNLEPGSYRVTETSLPNYYTLITSNNLVVVVPEEGVGEADFVNEYYKPPRDDPDPTRLIVKKIVKNAPDGFDDEFDFEVDGRRYDKTFDLGDGDTWRDSDIDPGDYVVEESIPNSILDGYDGTWETSIKVSGGSFDILDDLSVEVDVEDEETVTVTYTNTFIEDEEEEEITIAPPVTPLGTPDPEPEIILEDIVPLGLGTLPQTGQAGPELFYGFGSIIAGLGYAIRKIFDEK